MYLNIPPSSVAVQTTDCLHWGPWALLLTGSHGLILRLEVAQHTCTSGGLVHRRLCTSCTAGALLSVAWSASVAQHNTCPPLGKHTGPEQYIPQHWLMLGTPCHAMWWNDAAVKGLMSRSTYYTSFWGQPSQLAIVQNTENGMRYDEYYEEGSTPIPVIFKSQLLLQLFSYFSQFSQLLLHQSLAAMKNCG